MKTILNQLTEKVTRRLGVALFAGLLLLSALSAQAVTTVAITNPIPIIFGGAGVTGVYPGYTNSQVAFTLAGGTDLVNLRVNVVGSPAGVTAGFVGGGVKTLGISGSRLVQEDFGHLYAHPPHSNLRTE